MRGWGWRNGQDSMQWKQVYIIILCALLNKVAMNMRVSRFLLTGLLDGVYSLKSQWRPTRKVFVYKIQVNPIHTILNYGNYYDFINR